MSEMRGTPAKDVWVRASIGILAGVAVVTALIGFVWIPYRQTGTVAAGLWDAICRAAGLPQAFRPAQQPTTPVSPPSDVIVTADMLQTSDPDAIGRGATLALRCTMCHGAGALSEADSPNLAGQDGGAIYKELRDFRSNHRQSAVMGPLVQDLSDRDMRDLSLYYAYLPTPRNVAPATDTGPAPTIVTNGAPMRNIAPCEACHSAGYIRTGTPYLDGQPYAYLHAQLSAFKTGAGRNDLNPQMRNVARQMTIGEIEAASRYYASR